MPEGQKHRLKHGHAIEEVQVKLERFSAPRRVLVAQDEMRQRIALPGAFHTVASLAGKLLQFGEQRRSTLLSFPRIDCTDEVEVEVDREARCVEMQEVERRAATQKKLVGHTGDDVDEQGRQAEHALQRGERVAARVGDTLIVTPCWVRVHALSGAR